MWPVASVLDDTGLEQGFQAWLHTDIPRKPRPHSKPERAALLGVGPRQGQPMMGTPHKSHGTQAYTQSQSRKWQHCFLSVRGSVANAESVTWDTELV